MKKLTTLFIVIAASLTGNTLFAQCPYDNSLVASGEAPQSLNASVYATGVWGGEMIRITSAQAGIRIRYRLAPTLIISIRNSPFTRQVVEIPLHIMTMVAVFMPAQLRGIYSWPKRRL
jgi:hypothetical protein